MDQEKRTPKKDKHVKWDEDKLKETQKTRGTFQKINEPKTPYRGNSDQEQMDEEQKSEQEIEIDESLKQAQQNKETNRHNKVNLAQLNAKLKQDLTKFKEQQGIMQQEVEIETEEERKKKQEFKKKRASHYNQFQLIQQARNNKWEDDSDQ